MPTDLQKSTMKSFWKKPEGTTGKIVAGAAAIGGGVLTVQYLPAVLGWINMVLESTIYMCFLGGGLVLISSPIWSTKVRALTGYMLRSGLRALTGWFIEIDPIGVLKNYVEDLRKSLATMDAQIANLNGHLDRLKGIIGQNDADRAKSLRLAQAAKSHDSKAAFTLQARRAGRREQSNVTLQALLGKMQSLYRLLSKLREVSDVTVQDMEDEVQTKEQERNALTAGYGAFTSALKVLKGDPDKRALFDQAMEFLAADYSKKIGEIEDFMRVSEGFIASVDLENGLFEEDALKALDAKLDVQAEQLLLTPMNRTRIDEDELDQPAREKSGIHSLYK